LSLLETLFFAVIVPSLTGCANAQVQVKCGELPPIPSPPASSIPAQTFLSPEGRFKIGLPPTVAGKPESYDGPNGHIKTTRHTWFVLNHGQYQASYSDSDRVIENESDSKRILDNLRDLLLSKGGGTSKAIWS
jgi:hypothetical protein